MRKHSYIATYLVLLVVQIIICNYLGLSYYVMLNILPLAIILLPIGCSTAAAMLIAFVSALAVDLLCDGVPGLEALALVPVAFARTGIITLVFGSEVFARRENISVSKHGTGKMALAITLAQALFLAVYITADGAATRPLWFNVLKWGLSTLLGLAVSLAIAHIITADTRD